MLLSMPAGVAGGLGLICVGGSVAHASARRLDAGWVERALRRARGGGPAAVAVGAATALLPVGGVHARTPLALIESRQMRLAPGLLLALGVGAAELVTVGALVAGSARPATFLMALIALGLTGFAALGLRARGPLAGGCHLVAGWCLIVAGAHLLQLGCADLGRPLLADLAWGGFWPRAAALVLVAAALTATLDSGMLVAACAVGASAGGALESSTAAALLVGVRVGMGVSVLPLLRRAGGDARRAVLGVALTAVMQGLIGLLLVAILLPLLVHHGPAPVGPALTLLGFEAAFVLAALLAALPFHAPLVALLDERVEEAEATGPVEVEFPGLAHLALEDRATDLRRIARNQARTILAERGVTDFRMTVDLDRARRLAQDCEAISRRLLEAGLAARTAESLRAAARVGDLPGLIEELTALETNRLGWLKETEPQLEQLLRQAELAALHLVQGALGELARENARELEGQAQLLAEKLAEVERACLNAAAARRLDADQALAVVWRAGRLRWIGQLALGVPAPAEPSASPEIAPEEAAA